MTDLSPAAQAVLDAAVGAYEPNMVYEHKISIAAALRAAADQLCLRWSELSHPADVLNNIADELDAQ